MDDEQIRADAPLIRAIVTVISFYLEQGKTDEEIIGILARANVVVSKEAIDEVRHLRSKYGRSNRDPSVH